MGSPSATARAGPWSRWGSRRARSAATWKRSSREARAFTREWLDSAERVLADLDQGRAEMAANLFWTAKEAASKARRGGLRLNVRRARAEPDAIAQPPDRWATLRVAWEDGSSEEGWWRWTAGLGDVGPQRAGFLGAALAAVSPDRLKWLGRDSWSGAGETGPWRRARPPRAAPRGSPDGRSSQGLSSLMDRLRLQLCRAVLGDHDVNVVARGGYHGAALVPGHDPRAHLAGHFAGGREQVRDRWGGGEAGTGHEVLRSADPGELISVDGVGDDLAADVDRQRSVDRDHLLVPGNQMGGVDDVHRRKATSWLSSSQR